jgi:putative SOS response-associated peptidase YedK
LVVLRDPPSGARVLGEMRWGLDAGGRGARLTHARAETIAARPALREALRARRCIVPMDGYVQRATCGEEAGRDFAVSLADGAPMALAAIWDEAAEGAAGFAVVTCTANEALAWIHDRMPVLLPPEAWPIWLAGEDARLEDALALLRPCAPGLLRVRPVAIPAGTARRPRRGHPAEQVRLLGLGEPAPAVAPRRAAAQAQPRRRRTAR